MDAADICSAAAKALSIELGGPDYMAIIAAGKTQAALHGGENAGGGADAP
ncbi:hypothetical protein ACFQE0_26170 [Methylobacterium komagatae]|uniref:Uncharacterized protein n=1 Tax=Methylobacterium komagatae TaxID=374425 RepID=A0ABW2BR80_9HYPH